MPPTRRTMTRTPAEEEEAVGQGAAPGKSGWSLAADVSFVDVRFDQVMAFIDDVGSFSADDIEVTAVNAMST